MDLIGVNDKLTIYCQIKKIKNFLKSLLKKFFKSYSYLPNSFNIYEVIKIKRFIKVLKNASNCNLNYQLFSKCVVEIIQ
jgi:hypothetical protein